MPATNKCIVAHKPKDFYGFLAYEYIFNHISVEKHKNSDLQTEKGIVNAYKERLGFTVRLMKLKDMLMSHADDLGLLSGRLPDSNLVTQVGILYHHFDRQYLTLVKHLNRFKPKSSKRSELRRQMEKKLNEAVEKLKEFQDVAEEERQQAFVYGESFNNSNLDRDCSAYINYLHVLLAVFDEEMSDYVRELELARTVWQKVWDWFRTCGCGGVIRRNNTPYGRI